MVRDMGIESMNRPHRSRFQVDWLLSNIRWLLLLAVAIVAFVEPGRSGESFPLLIGLLLIGAVYNLVLLLLLAFGYFPEPLPAISLLIDSFLAVAFVSATGGASSPLLFFALFPIITAALRFGWTVSVVTASGIVVAILIVSIRQQSGDSSSSIFPMLISAVILLLAALITGLIGSRVIGLTDKELREEEENELRRLRAIRERTRAIYEMASTLSATLNYERVLEAMLDVSVLGLDELGSLEEQMVSMVLLFGERELFVTACHRLNRADQTQRVPGRDGIIGEALNSAEPAITYEPRGDPEIGRFVAFQYLRSVIAVPLRAGFESFGVVVFGSPLADTFTPDRVELLVAICNQAIIALQNAQLYQDLMAEKERIVEIEEDERKRLARNLHDGPTQSIAAIAMRLNYVRVLLNRDPNKVGQELANIEDLARRTTKEIRQMLFTLRPIILETQGLTAALEQYFQKLEETDSIHYHLQAHPVEEHLDMDAQGHIFYIIDECITNARKYAHANHVWVRLGIRDSSFVAQVEDDGSGFDVAAIQARYDERGSLGMINLHERTELLGGKLRIESAPGKGTRITVIVPLVSEMAYE
jgi:signal transduction histidine kinase